MAVFTDPSASRHSYGTELHVSDDGVSYAQIEGAEIHEINGEKSTGERKATHLLSPDATEETKPGLKKPGKLSLKVAFTNAAYAQVNTYYEDRSIQYWKIVFPLDEEIPEVTNATLVGRGFVMDIKESFSNADADESIMFDVDIRRSGKWTFTEAT